MARQGKASKGKGNQSKKTSAPVVQPPQKSKRLITQVLAVLALGTLVVALVVANQPGDPIGIRATGEGGPQLVEVDFQGDRSTWELLALSDEDLEKVSLVEMNLATVREIPGYEDLDAAKYEAIVDQWAKEFAEELPKIDATFRGREEEYKNDLRFYRIGQLMAWLGHKKNIEYIPEQPGGRGGA